MSDYGDDFSDYGEDWFFVEEEYMIADDLAEHAVQSPPPTTTYDEDLLPDWDRFDYFNDLEYASDGYDNANFEPHGKGKGATKTGQKRKRGATAARGRKKQRVVKGGPDAQNVSAMLTNSPIVWRSQTNRGAKPRLLAENAESYSLLKDWREKLADVPQWAKTSPHPTSAEPTPSRPAGDKTTFASEPMSPASEPNLEEEEDAGIDPAALMAALQNRLAAAGGPLSGMDPQQLLQFAMRMANDGGEGDDIAGEMADEMLNQGGEEEEDEEAEANLLSWVAQQRGASKNETADDDSLGIVSTPDSPDAPRKSKRPPTPPLSEANRSIRVCDGVMEDSESKAQNSAAFTKNSSIDAGQMSRKRKADDTADPGSTTNATKRRAMRSFEAPTTASQARAAPPKTTRSGHVKR